MQEKIKKNKKMNQVILFAVGLFIIDQIVKIWISFSGCNLVIIPNILEITAVQNDGGAFGIGQGSNPITFIITNLIVLGLILRFIILQKERIDTPTMYALFLVLAGGFGNIVDRLFRGFVVDFIQIFPSTRFPVFNLADCYIVIGWVILAFVFAKFTYQEIKERKKDKEEKK